MSLYPSLEKSPIDAVSALPSHSVMMHGGVTCIRK